MIIRYLRVHNQSGFRLETCTLRLKVIILYLLEIIFVHGSRGFANLSFYHNSVFSKSGFLPSNWWMRWHSICATVSCAYLSSLSLRFSPLIQKINFLTIVNSLFLIPKFCWYIKWNFSVNDFDINALFWLILGK